MNISAICLHLNFIILFGLKVEGCEFKTVISVSPFQREHSNRNLGSQNRPSFRAGKIVGNSPKLAKKTQYNKPKEFAGIPTQKEYDVGLLRRGSVRIKRAFR